MRRIFSKDARGGFFRNLAPVIQPVSATCILFRLGLFACFVVAMAGCARFSDPCLDPANPQANDPTICRPSEGPGDAPTDGGSEQVTLTVQQVGSAVGMVRSDVQGTLGAILCGGLCTTVFGKDEANPRQVVLTATNDVEGAVFVGWEECPSPGESDGLPTCTLSMTGDITQRVRYDLRGGFTQVLFTVTGRGNVVTRDGKINCGTGGSVCTALYPTGSERDAYVILQPAIPNDPLRPGGGGDCNSYLAAGFSEFFFTIDKPENMTCSVAFFGPSAGESAVSIRVASHRATGDTGSGDVAAYVDRIRLEPNVVQESGRVKTYYIRNGREVNFTPEPAVGTNSLFFEWDRVTGEGNPETPKCFDGDVRAPERSFTVGGDVECVARFSNTRRWLYVFITPAGGATSPYPFLITGGGGEDQICTPREALPPEEPVCTYDVPVGAAMSAQAVNANDRSPAPVGPPGPWIGGPAFGCDEVRGSNGSQCVFTIPAASHKNIRARFQNLIRGVADTDE